MYDNRGKQLGPEALGNNEKSDDLKLYEFHQQCEKAIKYFLGQTGFKFHVQQRTDSRKITDELEMNVGQWIKVSKELTEKKILSVGKSRKDLPRPDLIEFSLDHLAKAKGEPYVTEEIIQLALDQAAAQKNTQQ